MIEINQEKSPSSGQNVGRCTEVCHCIVSLGTASQSHRKPASTETIRDNGIRYEERPVYVGKSSLTLFLSANWSHVDIREGRGCSKESVCN